MAKKYSTKRKAAQAKLRKLRRQQVNYFEVPKPLWKRIKHIFPRQKRRKGRGRPPLPNRLVLNAINKILNPQFCIFDGSYFLDYTGPLMGEAVPMSLLIAGNDVGAASLACCEIMGLAPTSVPHHRLAITEGMFPVSDKSILMVRSNQTAVFKIAP